MPAHVLVPCLLTIMVCLCVYRVTRCKPSDDGVYRDAHGDRDVRTDALSKGGKW